MTSWANIAKKNTTNKLDANVSVNSIITENTNIDNCESDKMYIKNRHAINILDIYNILLEKVNNGYFTVLTIDTNNRQNQFINMILNNMNIDYHLKHDNVNSDSDVQENVNSDDESEFIPSYSKFAYI